MPLPSVVLLLILTSLSVYAASSCPDPSLLTNPYVPPWRTLPPTPSLNPTKTGQVTVDDGVKIWYALSGQKISPSRVPVLFLHGGFANSDWFGNQIACLEREYAIISIDSRGHGRSTDGEGPITYDRMTLDVVQVLDALKVPAVSVVGWSDGGNIGLDLAMNYSSRVDRVFAFGATFSPSNGNTTNGNPDVLGAYDERIFEEYTRLSPDPGHFEVFAEKVLTMFETLPQWGPEAFATIPPGLAPKVFIVDGEQEEAVNRDTPFIMRDWLPNSQLILLPGTSHFAFVQDPVTFTGAVRRVLEYR